MPKTEEREVEWEIPWQAEVYQKAARMEIQTRSQFPGSALV